MCVGYSGGTRSRLTVVGGMASGLPWTGVNIICQYLNLLKTKRDLLYLKTQFVPRCKHFPPRL